MLSYKLYQKFFATHESSLTTTHRDAILEKTESIKSSIDQLLPHVKKYDFDTIETNGLRSCIKIFQMFVDMINSDKGQKLIQQKPKELEDVTDLMVLMADLLTDQIVETNVEKRKLRNKFDLAELLVSIPEEKFASLASIGYFWLPSDVRFDQESVTLGMSLGTQEWRSFVNAEHRYRQRARQTVDLNMDEFREMSKMMEVDLSGVVYKYAIPCSFVEQVALETECDFELQTNGSILRQLHKSTVPIQIIRNGSDQRYDGMVIYHAHAGGFVFGKPCMWQFYLRQMARAIPGVTIVTPDYGLSPEHKYPKAVQDMTDVYCHLADPVKARALLGFEVKKFVLFSDSAGGTLHLAMSRVLAELGRPVPEHMLLAYPGGDLSIGQFTPAVAMVITEALLTVGQLFNFTDAYTPGRNTDYSTDRTPWFKRGREQFLARLEEMATMTENDRFLNPILGSFDIFKQTKIVLIACEFDALLDGPIEIARRWPDKSLVDLVVMKGMAHGFIGLVSKSGRNGTRLIFDKLIELLEK